jgi:hypothetical protein
MGKASLDIESLRLDPSLVGEAKPARRKPRLRGRFLKGPVPMPWLAQALHVGSGSGLMVGNILWHLSGLKHHEKTILLSNVEVERWGISRQAKWRALGALERAGLITIERRRTRSPMVTLVVDIPREGETDNSSSPE